MDVIVATRSGIPEEELLAELTSYFEEKREIAVEVQVKAPAVKTVDVAVKVTAAEGMDHAKVKDNVENALREYFSGERLSEDILVARLNQLVFSAAGVANCAVLSPAADVPVAKGELPRLGNLTVGVEA